MSTVLGLATLSAGTLLLIRTLTKLGTGSIYDLSVGWSVVNCLFSASAISVGAIIIVSKV